MSFKDDCVICDMLYLLLFSCQIFRDIRLFQNSLPNILVYLKTSFYENVGTFCVKTLESDNNLKIIFINKWILIDFWVHVFSWKTVEKRISWFGKINWKKLGHQRRKYTDCLWDHFLIGVGLLINVLSMYTVLAAIENSMFSTGLL